MRDLAFRNGSCHRIAGEEGYEIAGVERYGSWNGHDGQGIEGSLTPEVTEWRGRDLDEVAFFIAGIMRSTMQPMLELLRSLI